MQKYDLPLIEEALAQVGADPLPDPQIRDWGWLFENIGERAESYLEDLEARGVEPDFGNSRFSGIYAGMRPVADDEVRDDFATASIFVRQGGARYRLRAADTPADTACPISEDIGFASLTRPDDGGGSLIGPEGFPIVGSIAADSRWTDRMIAGPPEGVRQFAHDTGQRYFALWRAGRGHGSLDVIEAETGQVVSHAPALLTRAHLTCPLITDSACGQLCRMYGGPWVSRSIHAAAWWSSDRSKRLFDVGCDTCGDGAVTIGIRGADGRRLYATEDAPSAIVVASAQRPEPGRPTGLQPVCNRYGRQVELED